MLYQQLTSLGGPLLGKLDFGRIASETAGSMPGRTRPTIAIDGFGLPREQFGKHPLGKPSEGTSLITSSPSVLEVRVPADLAVGREFVVTASLDRQAGAEGSVQAQVRHRCRHSGTRIGPRCSDLGS